MLVGMARSEPPQASDTPPAEPEVWLVDGYNLLHAGVLRGRDRRGWWTAEAQARAIERIARFDGPGELWVVFDRRERTRRGDAPGGEAGARATPADPPGPPRVRVAFAPSADDWLVRRVREAADPSRLAVVTADRRLAGRARHRGARVVPPSAFLARCPAGERADDPPRIRRTP